MKITTLFALRIGITNTFQKLKVIQLCSVKEMKQYLILSMDRVKYNSYPLSKKIGHLKE